MYCFASLVVNLSSHVWSGLLKLMATFSTAVLIRNKSALIMLARMEEPKSLSITASTPTRFPSGVSITGMPPPPTATTTKPARIRLWIASASTILWGIGEGTTRRHPRPASSTMVQPSVFIFSLAWTSSMKEPIGLVGFLKAGSSRSTIVWVTTVTAFLSIDLARNWLCRICWNM